MVDWSKEVLEERAAQCGLPRIVSESLIRYILFGYPLGHFLSAILTNNLKEACNRADDENKRLIYQYVFFLYNYAPQDCWGSEEAVKAWTESRRSQIKKTGS